MVSMATWFLMRNRFVTEAKNKSGFPCGRIPSFTLRVLLKLPDHHGVLLKALCLHNSGHSV